MGEHRRSEVQTGGRPLPRPVPFRPRLIPRSHTEKCVSRFISETADDGALQGRSEPGTRATVCEAESQAKTGSRFQISANTQLTSSVSVDAVLAHSRRCHELNEAFMLVIQPCAEHPCRARSPTAVTHMA